MYYIEAYTEKGLLTFCYRSSYPERCIQAYKKACIDESGTVDTNIPERYFELYTLISNLSSKYFE